MKIIAPPLAPPLALALAAICNITIRYLHFAHRLTASVRRRYSATITRFGPEPIINFDGDAWTQLSTA